MPVGGYPAALAYDSNKGEVIVANYNSTTVSIISDSSSPAGMLTSLSPSWLIIITANLAVLLVIGTVFWISRRTIRPAR